jgi:hypothetical protein
LETLARCEAIVRKSPQGLFSGDEGYDHPVGPHFRHCLEHVTCFLDGLEQRVIEYDGRERDTTLERDPEAFLAALIDARRRIEGISPDSLQGEITVVQTPSLDSPPIRLQSTVERELVFLSSHTIHHIALIKHICEAAGVELPEGTGLAFSTAVYQQSIAG